MQPPVMLMESSHYPTSHHGPASTGYLTPMSHETSPTALLYDVGARLASVCEESQGQRTSPTFQHQSHQPQQQHHLQQQSSVEFYSSSGGGSDMGMGGVDEYRIDEG